MGLETPGIEGIDPVAETAIRALYQRILDAWNNQDAADLAASFRKNCLLVGFDGSQMVDRAEVESTLATIFAEYPTGLFLSIVRSVRSLTPEVATLHAVVGMMPRGKSELIPNVNAVQVMTAVQTEGVWLAAALQTTPAAFHGCPELAAQLTEELQALLPLGEGSSSSSCNELPE
ncbi:SgcJ/EcaC family oxidoreductase [Singulisphaera sp. PoT]|uniref:SgcJ/EcaC family oxidoreductase n=1 Tax=Singulisphaera sp. PoT TaxID=3411797 RepID=UPI003BF585D3